MQTKKSIQDIFLYTNKYIYKGNEKLKKKKYLGKLSGKSSKTIQQTKNNQIKTKHFL